MTMAAIGKLIGQADRRQSLRAHASDLSCRAYAVAIIVTACLAFAGASTPASAATCPNEAIREGQGAAGVALPGCRAYELVSPKSVPWTANTGKVPIGARAADDGDAMGYFTYYPYQGATSAGLFYRARRGGTGWSLETMSPQTVPGGVNNKTSCERTELHYSASLEASLLSIGFEIKEVLPGESFCLRPASELAAGEPVGFRNLLRRSVPEGAYELVNLTPSGVEPGNAQFQDASSDLSHIVFSEKAQLTPEAPAGYDLYEWVDGDVKLVTVLPGGTPVRGDVAGAVSHEAFVEGTKGPAFVGGTVTGTAPFTHAVSDNGEVVFFYADGNLYARRNAGQPPTASGSCSALEPENACTVQVDATKGAGESGGGVFQYASSDGSRVFFTDESRLTSSATATTGKPDLYEYDTSTKALKDLTVTATGAANVRAFSGASEDGSHLYFMAKGVLTEAQNADGESAVEGQPNLYLVEEGAVTYIATLDPTADGSAWGDELEPVDGEVPLPSAGAGAATILATATSPSGRYLAFNSVRGLGGVVPGTEQIYLFDAETGSLVCASCLPDGAAPSGSSELPAAMTTAEQPAPAYLPRRLTDSGQLFFSTGQALLPGDTNAVSDVYEYRAGSGLNLISDGAGTEASYFFEASEGGGDVFFGTADALVPSDTDNAFNLYDASVEGGFPEATGSAAPCSAAESCRSAGASPSTNPTPATVTGSSAGNVAPAKHCKKGQVRRKGHCVKSPSRHKKHTKHHRKKKPKQKKKIQKDKRRTRGAAGTGAGR